jgi:hypothetical protein
VRDSVRDGIDGVVVAAQPEGDRPHRLASALAALAVDDRRRVEMAGRARGDADRFSIDHRTDELEALYRSLLA